MSVDLSDLYEEMITRIINPTMRKPMFTRSLDCYLKTYWQMFCRSLVFNTQHNVVMWNTIPDFVLYGKTERWIDAKLSENTVFSDQTIEKYSPYCHELTIVYLHGDKNRYERMNGKG